MQTRKGAGGGNGQLTNDGFQPQASPPGSTNTIKTDQTSSGVPGVQGGHQPVTAQKGPPGPPPKKASSLKSAN